MLRKITRLAVPETLGAEDVLTADRRDPAMVCFASIAENANQPKPHAVFWRTLRRLTSNCLVLHMDMIGFLRETFKKTGTSLLFNDVFTVQ
jgi:hypothetical protein